MTYTDLPIKLSTSIGFVFLAGSIVYAFIIVVQYFFFNLKLPEGQTFIILYLSFLLGAVIFNLGILGSYVFRVFQEVLRRPRYLIDEIIDNQDGN